MTDRVKGFTVVLDKDYRTDDVEAILSAIKMVKGVLTVSPLIVDPSDYINRMRIQSDLEEKIFAVLHPDLDKIRKKG